MSFCLFALLTEVAIDIRQYFSLLELSFVLFHLHVHLGEGLLVQLLLAYLIYRVWTQVLELMLSCQIHTGLPGPELLGILHRAFLAARPKIVVLLR